MKFSIGYPLSDKGQGPFTQMVLDYKEHIEEVYFAWVGMASGRAASGIGHRGAFNWRAQKQTEKNIRKIKKAGIGLNLLFNANCYGRQALSIELENEVKSIIDYVNEAVGKIDAITTTSLAIAYTVKQFYPHIDCRASVNMRIGTVEGMQHVSGLFDSYVVQRDVQRYIPHMKSLRKWCDKNGKKLHMLANSGCIRYCPGQTFDDNIVAHDRGIAQAINIQSFRHHVCSHAFQRKDKEHTALQATWIRPEDLHNYKRLTPVVKLATRVHPDPRKVVGAYVGGSFKGNLFELFEPAVGTFFEPYILNNSAFPKDWFKQTSTCGLSCDYCGYCEDVKAKVFQKVT